MQGEPKPPRRNSTPTTKPPHSIWYKPSTYVKSTVSPTSVSGQPLGENIDQGGSLSIPRQRRRLLDILPSRLLPSESNPNTSSKIAAGDSSTPSRRILSFERMFSTCAGSEPRGTNRGEDKAPSVKGSVLVMFSSSSAAPASLAPSFPKDLLGGGPWVDVAAGVAAIVVGKSSVGVSATIFSHAEGSGSTMASALRVSPGVSLVENSVWQRRFDHSARVAMQFELLGNVVRIGAGGQVGH